jgi:hypothetical protein
VKSSERSLAPLLFLSMANIFVDKLHVLAHAAGSPERELLREFSHPLSELFLKALLPY